MRPVGPVGIMTASTAPVRIIPTGMSPMWVMPVWITPSRIVTTVPGAIPGIVPTSVPRIVPTCIPRRAPAVADIDIKIHVRATVRIIRIIAVTIISVTQIQIDLIRSGDRNLTRRMITNDTFRIFSIRTTLGRRLILIAILIDNGIILTIRLLYLD